MKNYLLIVCICLSVGIWKNPEVAALEKTVIEPERRTSEACDARLDQQQKEIQELRKTLNKMAEDNKVVVQKEINDLQKTLNNMMEENKAGVTYVRWGRTACSSPATIVYTGHVGGANGLDKGGGVNYLCLPRQPEWGNRKDGLNDWHSKLYGSEYEHTLPPIFSLDNNGGHTLYDLDALCTMCFIPNRSAQIMIPAKRTCPEGWTMEYRGYLVTHMNQFTSKDFVCLDEAPEGLTGSYADLNGALFYPVEGVCGSLPCPPYVNGWELACVVCSK